MDEEIGVPKLLQGVHSSGKVIFSRWEHLGDPNKFPLFVMNPDGTRLFIMYGNHSPSASGSRVFLEARELSDGGLVCSVMERNSPFEGGAVAIIDISRSDDNLVWVTPQSVPFNNTNRASSALFKTPHPIIDPSAPADNREKLLVAMSPIPVNGGMGQPMQADYGIYVMDKDGGNVRLIYNDPAFNDYDAVPVVPRAEMPGGVPAVIPTDPNVAAGLASNDQFGTFFDGNVYDRATNDGQLRLFKFLLDLGRYDPARQRSDIASIRVTGYYDLSPIDARTALFVIGSDVTGPMGSELIPFATRGRSRGLSQRSPRYRGAPV